MQMPVQRIESDAYEIGQKIRVRRKELHLSQDDLAKLTGVSRQTISAIEKGDYNPTINLCIAICIVLGKTLDELFWPDA